MGGPGPFDFRCEERNPPGAVSGQGRECAGAGRRAGCGAEQATGPMVCAENSKTPFHFFDFRRTASELLEFRGCLFEDRDEFCRTASIGEGGDVCSVSPIS
jgi:hypothetical protein